MDCGLANAASIKSRGWQMERERILVTVRTYPNVSAAYIETVCTGGITDKGEWRRLVPVPLRYLEEEKQFRTFDVIEVKTDPGKDGRPETRKPHIPSLRVLSHVSDWRARWDWVRPTILPSLRSMRERNKTLAPIAVGTVLDFEARPSDADWTAAQKQKLRQAHLFDERKPLEKLPYDFRFRWRDQDGDEHDSLVLSWELLETYRQYRRSYNNPVIVMREKWLSDLCGPTRNVSFFVGNLAKRRDIYCVTGVFSPPKEATQDAALW